MSVFSKESIAYTVGVSADQGKGKGKAESGKSCGQKDADEQTNCVLC